MSTGATGATDPNGWLPPGTSPGAVMVKITGTSREELNGQLAVVLAYMEDKSRYLVHTTKEQQQLSLKGENLVKASWIEQMTGQYEMIQNHPDIQRKIQEYYNLIQVKTGIKPEYVGVGVLLALLGFGYVLGFTKTMLLMSFVMLVCVVVAPDMGSPYAVIARNFPMRVRAVIRDQIPILGPKIADNQYLSMAVVGLVVFFFLNALIRSPANATTATTSSLPSTPVVPRSTIPDRAMLEDFYKKGFEDAKAGVDFGTSLPVPETPVRKTLDDEFDDLMDPTFSSPPPVTAKKSPFDWSTLMSMFVLGSSVYTMGKTAEGGWDAQLALANLKTMEPWRMGLFGFSLYRVASAVYRGMIAS